MPGRNAHLVVLNLDKERFTKILERQYFPDRIRHLASEKKLSLEDVLGINEGSYLRILVKVTDSVSGATRVYRSRDYLLKDIVHGYFEKRSLNIIPNQEQHC